MVLYVRILLRVTKLYDKHVNTIIGGHGADGGHGGSSGNGGQVVFQATDPRILVALEADATHGTPGTGGAKGRGGSGGTGGSAGVHQRDDHSQDAGVQRASAPRNGRQSIPLLPAGGAGRGWSENAQPAGGEDLPGIARNAGGGAGIRREGIT